MAGFTVYIEFLQGLSDALLCPNRRRLLKEVSKMQTRLTAFSNNAIALCK